MKEDNVLQVYYGEKLVGTLALTADYKAAFQYAQEWLENGFSRQLGKTFAGSTDSCTSA